MPCDQGKTGENCDTALNGVIRRAPQVADAEDIMQEVCCSCLAARRSGTELENHTAWIGGLRQICTAQKWKRLTEAPISLEMDPCDKDAAYASDHRATLATMRETLDASESQFRPLFAPLQDRGYMGMRCNEPWTLQGDDDCYRRDITNMILRNYEILAARAHLTAGEERHDSIVAGTRENGP